MMITDSQVFREDHIPRDLPHRDQEVGQLSHHWTPVSSADDVLIHGPSGVGKTVLTRHTLDRLTRDRPTPAAYVETMGRTTGQVLRSILSQLGGHPTGNEPVDDLKWAIREELSDPGICVLDEADDLPGSEALEIVTSIDDLSLVIICHDEDHWLATVDGDVRRRFSTLRLRRYGVDELADILQTRAELGLRAGIYTREQLEKIADEVAGVAREGIQSLRASAELAQHRGHECIEAEDLRDSYDRARRRIRQQNLSSLPLHHHVLYEIIRQAEGLSGQALHHRYSVISERMYRGQPATPIGDRARRNKLSKLTNYDLITVEGKGNARRYDVVDYRVKSDLDIQVYPKH